MLDTGYRSWNTGCLVVDVPDARYWILDHAEFPMRLLAGMAGYTAECLRV
jgi:hypothetical protein